MNTTFTYTNYTVGWICALSKERTAATAMLDQIHPDLPKPPNDHNTYTLGSVDEHNVVIACLPKGIYGTHSAATVATQMVGTFQSIRFGLMVGIGSGISPNVRLGDVVVSIPVDQYPGVVQWDFGKVEHGNNFKRIGALSNPPTALLTAVTKLESMYEMNGSGISRHLNDLENKWPRLAPEYIRCNSLVDPHFAFNDVSDSCTTETAHSIVDTVVDKEQTGCRDIRVHYGLIASGNQVINDAKFRDNLNQSLGGNVLCVETEAAGLMNDFPCLVIRGICDYADSHKDEAWQEYAAAVAAAFAKDLLFVVPTQELKQMPTIKVLLGIDGQLKEVSRAVNNLSSNQSYQADQGILDWLTPIDYALQQNDYFKQQQPGTGQWLLDSVEYQNWLRLNKQTLFCPGIPGAGKTILTSIIVDDLYRRFYQDPTVKIAYIYFNCRRTNEQTTDQLYENVLKQLSQGRSSIPDVVKQLYEKSELTRLRPSLATVLATLQSVVAMYSRVFIIIDALDECQVRNGCRVSFLKEIFGLQARYGVNFIATSRFITDILVEFEGYPTLEIQATDADLRRYLDGYLPNLPSFIRSCPGLFEEIREAIVEAVDGMFLLARLYAGFLEDQTTLKALRTALKRFQKYRKHEGEDHRLKLLADAYDQTMERVESQKPGFRQLALHALSWITFARRPLTVLELQTALGVEIDEHGIDEENIPQIEEIISVCAGLVVTDEQSGIVRLVHYTTQEYLKQTKERWLPNAEDYITDICMSYLLFSNFTDGRSQTEFLFEKRLYLNCLYDYVAKNWGHHAGNSVKSNPKIIRFLESGALLESAIQAMMAVKEGSWDIRYSQRVPTLITGIHVTAYFGLSAAMSALISKSQSHDSADSHGRTPLSWAAEKGHEVVIELLIDNGAQVDRTDIDDRTPLLWAVRNCHEAAVKTLVQRNANTNTADIFQVTPLHLASRLGYLAIMDLLLENGAHPDATDMYGGTPLAWSLENTSNLATQKLGAAKVNVNNEYMQFSTVRALLDVGRIEPRDRFACSRQTHDVQAGPERSRHTNFYRKMDDIIWRTYYNQDGESKAFGSRVPYTPLLRAVEKEDQQIVRMLLAMGSRPDQACDENTTPLFAAAGIQNASIIELFISGDSKYKSSMDQYGRSLLHIAAWKGSQTVVKLLLDKGINPDSRDSSGRTPLYWAAINGHEEIVKLLLEITEVNANSSTCQGEKILRRTAWRGHEGMVKLLLETNKINTDSKRSDAQEALLGAIFRGQDGLVKLLLSEGGVDPNASLKRGTPLSVASERGHESIVTLLLDTYKVNVNTKDHTGCTPLSNAVKNGHQAIIKLLLDRGAYSESKDENTRMPLGQVSQCGDEAAVNILSEKSSDGQSSDGETSDGQSSYEESATTEVKSKEMVLLREASKHGDEALVKIILERRAYTKSWSGDRQMLLPFAAKHGHEPIVRYLLKQGAKADSKDGSQRTPLSYAAQEGHVTIVKHLLDNRNVNLNSMSKIGYGTWRTPLSCAAENGHEMVVKLLLERGAKPELYIKSRRKRTPSKIYSETTPLGYAAKYGHKEVVKLLLEDKTLNPDKLCERYEMTPLAYAAKGGHEEVIKLLLEDNRVHPDKACNGSKMTPLAYAAESGHEAVVKLLLEDNRVHLDKASGFDEQTPLSYAATEGHEGVVKLLLEKGANPNLAITGWHAPIPAVMDLIRNKAEANLLLATSNNSTALELAKEETVDNSLLAASGNSTAPKLVKKETVDNSPSVAGGGDRGQTQVHNAYSLFSCFGFTRRKK